eukprot:TRINITY_DN42136_c0_g1_i1.p1 TRINITY_DN42136_c0_g1~~TRINITY_DN42136_c0_g1_i1.p1  ORF type:complete len:165 (+),score=76.74 TRINITY_DN42136_c0_g1_i1:206-700(+)
MEQQARVWIEAVTGIAVTGDFHEALKDGVTLCTVMNTCKPGAIKKINKMKMPFMQMENISNYLTACTALGVPAPELFQTVDLFEKQNMGAVVQNIHALSRHATAKGFRGATIGPKLSEKNQRQFDSKKDAEMRATVPSLTRETGSGATAKGVVFGKTRDATMYS